MQLSQAILFVHDAARMQAFYEQLGLRAIEGDAASGFLRMADPGGGAVLAIHFTKAIGPNTSPRMDTAIKLCFHVDDVVAERAQLVARGVTAREIHTYGDASYCDFVDPEGNIFQLTTR
ncbi:MAG TPA: VOC family protein [Kofleriaceae bacterium]|jgi:catechol 2,3-dioxygenase-like lactoylglutathione lyase family enzyme|nr:VOC family protein [Kofleriaceae bacterium]